MAKPQQVPIKDITVCSHTRVEPVLNYADNTVAWRCSGCTTITAHHGRCDGCGQQGCKLTCLVPTKRMRFCDVTCYKRLMARRRKQAADEAAALIAKPKATTP